MKLIELTTDSEERITIPYDVKIVSITEARYYTILQYAVEVNKYNSCINVIHVKETREQIIEKFEKKEKEEDEIIIDNTKRFLKFLQKYY